MQCGRCGEFNRNGARFCAACGDRLSRSCATCRAEVLESARFCDACGAPTAADGGPAASDQARKTVTVVFADLVGSTSMQERMDPESVRAFNARCYAAMRAAVERHGGRVVKFVGDGMMATFGVPEVREDDAARALSAAVDLHQEIAAAGRGVAVRVGVNTGEVVVDESDDDVVGDTVNVAARLEAAAPAGGVLVGEETYRLTRDHAGFAQSQRLQVKGRAEPVVARLLLSTQATAEDATAPFVGRDAELARLVDAFRATATTGTALLVTVLGSPGVGKSRLLAELQAAVGDDAIVLTGRCDRASTSAYAPLADIVAGAVEAAGGVDADVAEAVGFVMGAGDPGTPEQTFWGVRRAIEAAARVRPLVVVLDDSHWAEPLLLDLVEHLAEWLGPVPALVVVAARPELRELRPALVEVGSRSDLVLALEGLDADDTCHLADELLGFGGLPPAVADRVVSTTGGNPLFVRELVRMLVDDGVLRPDDGGWVLTVDDADVDVPPTISALLASRIERLRADERIVLERASVLGQEVMRGALAHLLPAASRDQLDVALESLRRKELLEPAGTYWIDEPVLRFHHALIRDAAYRRLLREARAQLHERAAVWIRGKTAGAEEHDELVGFHLEQAQANLRQLGELDDRGRSVAAEAAQRLASAARRALHGDDLPSAATLAARALACLDDGDPARAALLLVQAEALLAGGDVAGGRRAIDNLGELAASDARLTAWATAFSVQVATLAGNADLGSCLVLALDAAERLTALGDSTGAAKAHRVHASVLARLGRVGDAEAALDRALTAARDAGDGRQISGVLAEAPLAALWGPSPVPRAGGRCLDVVRLLRITTGARAVEAISTRCQAVLESFRGRHGSARRLIAGVRRTLEDLGLRHDLLELDLAAGLVELTAGEPADAMQLLRRAHDGFLAMGLEADAGQAAALAARAALALGDEDEALALAETAAGLGGSDLKTAIAWRAVKAEVLARRGSGDAAVALARDAVALAAPTDALVDYADALAALGSVLDAVGDEAGSTSASAQARALYLQKGATALAARSGEPLGVLLDEIGETLPTAGDEVRTGGPSTNRAAGVSARNCELMLAGRWDEFRDAMHPEIQLDDRRRGMYPRGLDREAIVESSRTGIELGITKVENEVLDLRGDDLVLVRNRVAGEGGFAVESLDVLQIDSEGLVVRTVQFSPEDLDAARAELESMAAGAARENTVVRGVRASDALILAGAWEEFECSLHPAYTYEDRRAGLTTTVLDRAASVANTRAGRELGVTAIDHEVLATRGDLAALLRSRITAGDFAVESLLVLTCDERGLSTRCVHFDPSQLTEAMAELVRVARDEPAGLENLATRTQRDGAAAMLAGDWERARAGLDPAFVAEDRCLGRAMTYDLDEHLANMQVVFDLGVTRIDCDVVAKDGDRAALLRLRMSGGDFHDEILTVFVVTDDGRGLRAVSFDPSSIDEALAELRRAGWVAGAGDDGLRNRATAAWNASERSAARRHDDRADASAALHVEDRRPLASADADAAEERGPVRWAELVRPATRIEVLAVRGDDLALLRAEHTSEHGVAAGSCVLVHVGAAAGGDLALVFEATDLVEAVYELDRRGATTTAGRVAAEFGHALNTRAWQRLGELLAPDVVHVDHRPVGFGTTVGVADTLARLESLVEVMPDHIPILRRLLLEAPGGILAHIRVRHRDVWRPAPESDLLAIVAVDADRVTRYELFAVDDEGAARRRFDDLAGA